MKLYTTTDGQKIKKVGRKKKIYFTDTDTYFMWNGRRQKLFEIPRLSYPIMYEDQDGKLGSIGGYITISNCFGVYVEVSADCETIQLWE